MEASDYFIRAFGLLVILSFTLGFTFSWIHERELKRKGEPRRLLKVASFMCDVAFFLFGTAFVAAVLAFVFAITGS